MRGLFILAGMAVLFLESYDGLIECDNTFYILKYFLPVYLGLLGGAFIWNHFAKSKEYQTKHLEYRTLAEGLRVQFFWKLAGYEEDVSQHYLRKQQSELEWIRNAIRSCNILVEKWEDEPIKQRKCRYWLVLRYWVKSQRKYFENSAGRDQKKVEHLEWLMKILIALGIGLALMMIGLDFTMHHEEFCRPESIFHKILRITMKAAPVIGAAFGGYAMKMALVEQAKRYERMGKFYLYVGHNLNLLIKNNDHENIRTLIYDLGEEALIENGDWLFLHRERPMEVPVGG